MKHFKRAFLIALLSCMLLPGAFIVFRLSEMQVSYCRHKHETLVRMQHDRQRFEDQMEALRENGKRLIALSRESRTPVDYEIVLEDHALEGIHEKIISTYQDGLFFLTSATLESGPGGILLAVKGYRVGEEAP